MKLSQWMAISALGAVVIAGLAVVRGTQTQLNKIDVGEISIKGATFHFLKPKPDEQKPDEEKPDEQKLNEQKPDEPLSKKDVEPIFEEFIDSWRNKDLNRQLALLSQDFKSRSFLRGSIYQECNFDEYKSLKQYLFVERYEKVKISTSAEKYLQVPDGMVVRYLQKYQGFGERDLPEYASQGTNELFFRKNNGKVEIFREDFNLDSSNSKRQINNNQAVCE